MYTPQDFKIDDPELIRLFIEENSFGILVSSRDGSEVDDTHLPLVLSDDGNYLLGHIAKANKHWRNWETNPCVKVIFHGPHSYVSPTYYASEFNVPTWNYTAVSISGSIVFFRIRVQKTEAKFKLNQNKSLEDQKAVIKILFESESTFDREIARIMSGNLDEVGDQN
ncbi:MAG: FMN-binding negative transcriptional regulator [Verrucomicrobiales bacterium]